MSSRYTFGPFLLEPGEHRLTRDGEVVPLTGKAFDALVLLVEGAGTLQTHRSLIDRLWPETHVEPNNLQQSVSLIRRALGSDSGVEIQTVRGQGYRLVAQVEVEEGLAVEVPPSAVQRTRFARASDDARLAFATLGEGPPIVKAANWLSHVELDRDGAIWRHWLHLLSRGRTLVRYDARGNGLSDPNPGRIGFEEFVSDLATIMDAAQIERAPIVGLSQGAAVAAAYAARHPERVSALVLFGGCARGWRVKRHPSLDAHFEALMLLTRQGWGGENPAFRQIFTTAFFPEATREQAEWFNELQRVTATPENAARMLSALGDVDVREALGNVRAPTLVLHSRDDNVVPMKDGIELASGIPGARFVPLSSKNHILLAEEPAWGRFVAEFEAFLVEHGPAGGGSA
jgi:pimeloyl-ACP methyl ester carboxylesterase